MPLDHASAVVLHRTEEGAVEIFVQLPPRASLGLPDIQQIIIVGWKRLLLLPTH